MAENILNFPQQIHPLIGRIAEAMSHEMSGSCAASDDYPFLGRHAPAACRCGIFPDALTTLVHLLGDHVAHGDWTEYQVSDWVRSAERTFEATLPPRRRRLPRNLIMFPVERLAGSPC